MVNVAVAGDPVFTAASLIVPNDRLTDSSSLSASSVVLIVKLLVLSPEAILTVVLVGEKSPDSALPAVTEMGMLNERFAAGDTFTVIVWLLPSVTV